MVLILSRHGETEENRRNELQGQRPGILSELGWKQANELAKLMEGVDFDVVVSSDLARSYNTAKCVADLKGIIVMPTALLREMDWGVYTGKALAHVDWFNLPESVENIEMLYTRAERFIEYLRSNYADKVVFAVGHGAFNRAIECVVKGLDPREMVDMPIMDNTTCKRFEI